MTTIGVQHIQGTAAWSTSTTQDPYPLFGIYYTHDNGGRPYKVIINNNSQLNKNSNKIEIFNNYNGCLIAEYNHIKIWIGESPHTEMTDYSDGYGEKFIGNSILIEIQNDYYIFIGDTIYSFIAENKIIKYVSEVGNNDVPYPYAVDSNNQYYLMIEGVILKNIPTEYNYNPYGYYYHSDTKEKYKDILGIQGFNADNDNDTNNEKEFYFISFQTNPREHYNRPWMKNLHATNIETGSDNYPVSEDDYVKMMETLSLECGYKILERKIIHRIDYNEY